ncbi:MAG: hypothetical protein GY703_06875 [Gammaproteobacteria bacterium]|nr:hypothetical protein [Gammaproteobacteria bacterium]
MRITVKDPMALNDTSNRNNAPFFEREQGHHGIMSFFDSEESRFSQSGLNRQSDDDLSGLKEILDAMAENPDSGLLI